MRNAMCALVAMAWAGPAAAQTPAFDPREWKGTQAGAPTQMLTLGSFHLSQAAVAVDAAMMSALLDKLAAYKPDIITVETVSGEQCEHMKRFAATYPDSFDSWCLDTEVAQKAVGMDGPAAAGEARKMLAAWPAQPAPAQRRRLAALFLAAGEKPSAVVQWRRLPPEERRVGDGVIDETLKSLERKGARPNETYDVAVTLAVRLGLERVHLVDDHTVDAAFADEAPGFGPAVEAAWKLAPSSAVAEEKAMEARMKTPADVLEIYRFLNRPETQRRNIKADFGANLAYPTPELYGRHYVVGWQVRNLRMVSNIMSAAALHPGARVLNIVGASHKAYYDAYLDMMHDVDVVDAEEVLR